MQTLFIDNATFPIEVQVRKHLLDWKTHAVYQTPTEMKFRECADVFDDYYDEIRFVDGNGMTGNVNTLEFIKTRDRGYQLQQPLLANLKPLVSHAPDHAMEIAQDMITNGLATKHFSIAEDSTVELNHQIIDGFEFAEYDKIVVVLVKCGLSPVATPSIIIHKDDSEFSGLKDTVAEDSIKAFLYLLVASITRDFWTLEKHNPNYLIKTETERKREGKGKDRQLIKRKQLKSF